MTLFQNPIFLTQKRLVHRAGVLAAFLIASLLGLSLLSGLLAYLAEPETFGFRSRLEAGKTFYGWVVGLEILVLVVGGFSRIARSLADDRKAGLWDSNRLTPLPPPLLIVGYWFGAALREFYMAAGLAVLGLAIVVIGKLPLTLWLGTQVLVAGAALFFGLLAVLTGMASQRPQSGILLLLAFIVLQAFSLSEPRFVITNFLLPIYGIANLFQDQPGQNAGDWSGFPDLFGVPVHPILFSLGLQLVVGLFLWRAAVRRAENPFHALLPRREAVALFGVLILTQHGLIWGLWHGRFGAATLRGVQFGSRNDPMLAIVHCGAMLMGAVLLAFASPQPERVRVDALRSGIGNLSKVFRRSAAFLALPLAAVAAAALFSQCVLSLAVAWKAAAAASANLLAFFLIFPLLLEFCRLRFQRRAFGFLALALFVLCALPFVFAGVFSNAVFGRLSLLSPGVVALGDPASDEVNDLLQTDLAHLLIAAVLFVAWRREWKRLLNRTTGQN